MDLWRGSLSEFIRAAESGALAGDMTGQFVRIYQAPPSPAEVRSWNASLPSLASALTRLRERDLGIRLSEATPAPAVPVGVATEYHLPLSGQRLDVLLCGRDRVGQENALVVELKQWSSADLENEFATNVLAAGGEHLHPSQQALDYADWLSDYHGAFVDRGVRAVACSYLHNLAPAVAGPLTEPRFRTLLERSPVFIAGQADTLAGHVQAVVGHGDGASVLDKVTGAGFKPSPRVLENLERVIRADEAWHLIGTQRLAYNAILAEVQRLKARRGRSAILVRGGPGTGKSVIAIQLLADALRLGLKAAHCTGGKAFTTTLRGQFKGASRLFRWNMEMRNAPSQGLDLLLVDEAHRVRETSDIRWTPKAERGRRPQVRELMEAAKVSVFFLDENQFVRPDEVGNSELIVKASAALDTSLRTYDLTTQFRCGGCAEYISWVDALLGFASGTSGPWRGRYRVTLLDAPEQLDQMLDEAARDSQRARVVAGFCWDWSEPNPDGTLVEDVQIGSWRRPWNRKAKGSPPPDRHPYTLWATTDVGRDEVGCIYSAQGFEFDKVAVIWGRDLVWRGTSWTAQREYSKDRAVRPSPRMLDLVRNAYRVLLTRGIKETRILCLDDETRAHIESRLRGMQ